MHLKSQQLAPGTAHLRLRAVRRPAYGAFDCGLLSPDLGAGTWFVSARENLVSRSWHLRTSDGRVPGCVKAVGDDRVWRHAESGKIGLLDQFAE